MKYSSYIVLLCCLLAQSLAIADNVEFSAETYQKTPDGKVRTGKMYVGKQHLRSETASGTGQVISILDQQHGRQLLLFPARRGYTEKVATGSLTSFGSNTEFNPCSGLVGAKCERLGDVQLEGRDAVKWKIALEQQGKTRMMVQWIDKRRDIPLRSEMSGGQSMSMNMVQLDVLEGRTVEKWESVYDEPGGKEPQKSYQWYDPGLDLVIREELPGGYLRALTKIKVGPQAEELFEVPKGWSRVGAQPKVGSR